MERRKTRIYSRFRTKIYYFSLINFIILIIISVLNLNVINVNSNSNSSSSSSSSISRIISNSGSSSSSIKSEQISLAGAGGGKYVRTSLKVDSNSEDESKLKLQPSSSRSISTNTNIFKKTHTYQISSKPCIINSKNDNEILRGTCMFVWECIKSEGKHLGMCIDGFMFGSCCSHNDTHNTIIPSNDNNLIKTSSTTPSNLPFVTSNNSIFTTTIIPTSTTTTTTSIKQPWTTTKQPWTTTKQQWITTKQPWTTTKQPWTTTFESFLIQDTSDGNIEMESTEDIFTMTPSTTERFTTTRKSTTTPPTTTTSTTTTTTAATTTTTTEAPPPFVTFTDYVPTFTTTSTTIIPLVTLETNSLVTTTLKPEVPKDECGVAPLVPQKRIVGGKEASFGNWPWIVSVRRTSFFGFSSTHRCGGTLINENWVITAGHCVDDLLISQIRIRIGEWDFSVKGGDGSGVSGSGSDEKYQHIERGVLKKVVHGSYNFFTYENDLALLYLDGGSINYSQYIRPLCLQGNKDLLVGYNATVAGWGRLSEGGTLPNRLQQVNVPIMSNEECRKLFLKSGRVEHIPDIFLCAGYPNGGRDSCQGDSGGPLQVKGSNGRWFLAGIISWGIGCAEPNMPGVCTRISKFTEWILKHVT